MSDAARHVQPDGSPRHTNALARTASPYLLQHAHNPVEWYPWGPEAFELARTHGKPIFLSVGYSTCYWCHVMERQSFEDAQTAAVMNEHFVNIKVDREERPDVDDLYMAAVQMMTGRGGWPMSVFLTPPAAKGAADPGLRPFYAGTYFPPQPAHGMPSFTQVLEGLSQAWREQRAQVLEQADRVADAVAAHLRNEDTAGQLSVDMVSNAANQLLRGFDAQHGGFGGAPKFPQPINLRFLMAVHRNTPNEQLWQAIAHTLDRMARGGMYDQIGGGFHRYSVDAQWLVPHFEKMLYDNAQLVELYAAAHAMQPPANDPSFYADVVRHTCDYVLREMVDESGAFWSAQDAEVDAHEGGNYVWTPDEVRQAIGNDSDLAELALRLYGLDQGPNFRDPHQEDAPAVNVLFVPVPMPQLAEQLGLTLDELLARVVEIDRRLLAARNLRKQPTTDDKVLVSWNGLMIAALAMAGRVLGEARYVEVARHAADYILEQMRDDDGGLFRSMRKGVVGISAFLEDYANFTHGLLELHRAIKPTSGEAGRYLDAAGQLQRLVAERFAAPRGGYYDTLAGRGDLFVRARSAYDGALPSGNSVTIHNLLDLFELTGERAHLDRALADLQAFGRTLNDQPLAMLHLQHALLRAIEMAPAVTDQRLTATPEDSPVAATVSPQSLDPDAAAVAVQVTLTIADGYHLNGPDAAAEGLAPTQLLLKDSDGWLLDVQYPAPVQRTFPLADEPLAVYEGQITLTATLSRTGEGQVRPPQLLLRCQPCTGQTCQAPMELLLPLQWHASGS